MANSRALLIGKLGLLVALPLAVVSGLFLYGAHWGHERRVEILTFERDWLSMDVEVPAPPQADAGEAGAPKAEGEGEAPKGEGGAEAPKVAQGTAAKVPAATGAPAASGPAAGGGALEGGPGAQARPATATKPEEIAAPPAPRAPEATAYPLAKRPAIPSALEAKYAKPRTLDLKVVVDPEFVASRPDWMREVRELVEAMSANYDALFGVQLRLFGVVQWRVPTEGLDTEALHAALRERPREGADILLGITGRPLDANRYDGWSEIPGEDTPHNTAYALVYAVPGKPHQLLRASMHELAHLFGATDATDPSSNAWSMGSFMSYAFTEPGTAPVVDADNLARVLSRKERPFEPHGEGQMSAEGERNDDR